MTTTPASPTTVPASGRERAVLVAVFGAFAAFSAVAVAVDGLTGVVDAITFNWASFQIFGDLVIAIGVIAVWIHRDATARGRNPWPWIIASLFVGVLAPLTYLIMRTRRPAIPGSPR